MASVSSPPTPAGGWTCSLFRAGAGPSWNACIPSRPPPAATADQAAAMRQSQSTAVTVLPSAAPHLSCLQGARLFLHRRGDTKSRRSASASLHHRRSAPPHEDVCRRSHPPREAGTPLPCVATIRALSATGSCPARPGHPCPSAPSTHPSLVSSLGAPRASAATQTHLAAFSPSSRMTHHYTLHRFCHIPLQPPPGPAHTTRRWASAAIVRMTAPE